MNLDGRVCGVKSLGKRLEKFINRMIFELFTRKSSHDNAIGLQKGGLERYESLKVIKHIF